VTKSIASLFEAHITDFSASQLNIQQASLLFPVHIKTKNGLALIQPTKNQRKNHVFCKNVLFSVISHIIFKLCSNQKFTDK
jgi:hypothetical protein